MSAEHGGHGGGDEANIMEPTEPMWTVLFDFSILPVMVIFAFFDPVTPYASLTEAAHH